MSRLVLSDHAFARYCERVLGIDRAALEKALNATINPLGDGNHKLPSVDVVAIVRNSKVVTFAPFSTLPDPRKGKPKPPKFRQRDDAPEFRYLHATEVAHYSRPPGK